MRRLVANILRNRTAWQLVAIAALCTVVGLAIVYNSYDSTLRKIRPLSLLVFGGGGAALFMAIVRRAQEVERTGAAARGWGRFLAAIVGLAAAIAFVTYSFGHHRRHMVAGCNASRLPSNMPDRTASLTAAEAALRSPFALLPGLLDDEAARECARSRDDLARVERGLCTKWPLVDRPCACGDERYPYARCSAPRCLYEPGKPDRFDCPGDPVPEGYADF